MKFDLRLDCYKYMCRFIGKYSSSSFMLPQHLAGDLRLLCAERPYVSYAVKLSVGDSLILVV